MKLNLDQDQIESCRASASQIARDVAAYVDERTTVSTERAVARLLGVDGVNASEAPYPNVLVDHVARRGGLSKGICYWLGNAILNTSLTTQEIAERVDAGTLDLVQPHGRDEEVRRLMRERAASALAPLKRRQDERAARRRAFTKEGEPLIYVLTATGNVFEDKVHGTSVARFGGDIVAVIRSTAQSLLDYVPYGPTTQGFGGTYATQQNFRIMREALDEWSDRNARYVRLSSFCSGLCMPEIAAMGAIEGLDNMVNDALYGILYRDINMTRTLVDQKFSRMINGYFGITINTGEDNYLRTSDAVEAAPAVVASQMINYFLAKDSNVPDEHIAVGSAFEVDPRTKGSLLLEWAHAQLTRDLFPRCPVKYMPPTRHMDGNVYRTHACNTLFNLITKVTGQQIQTIGVPTEGIFTPHIHDRALGLENVRYVFDAAEGLQDELQFKPDGLINRRARFVLTEAGRLLEEIRRTGLFKAIESGVFGEVARSNDDGRGKEGVALKDPAYFNPFVELMSVGGLS